MQVDASQCKFAIPDIAYGLAKGGQTDLQSARKFTQVTKGCKFQALGGQTVKNLCRLAYKFELNQSQRKLSQVNASSHKYCKVANQNASLTQVEDMCGLVSPIVQGLKLNVLIGFSGGSKSFSKYMYVYLSCNTAFFFCSTTILSA